MPPATAPDLPALLAMLEAVEQACREARWDDAESLFAGYDAEVRAVPANRWQASDLALLMQRQQGLEAMMSAGRDAAAGELAQLGAQRRSVRAYQG